MVPTYLQNSVGRVGCGTRPMTYQGYTRWRVTPVSECSYHNHMCEILWSKLYDKKLDVNGLVDCWGIFSMTWTDCVKWA